MYPFLPLLISHEKVKLKFTKEAPIELTARTVTECACSVHRKVNLVWFPTSSDHVPLREVWCFTTYFLTLHNESFFIRGCSKHKNWLVQGLQCFLYQPSPWTLLIHSPLGRKVRTGKAPFSSRLRYREVRGDRAHLWPHTVKVSGWVWNVGNFFSSFWFFFFSP